MIGIPGLDTPLTASDLELSRQSYNELVDEPEPPPSTTLLEVCGLIASFGLEKKYQVHLSHRHLTLRDGHSLISEIERSIPAYWTAPRLIEHGGGLCGHIFVVDRRGRLVATEFQRGGPTQLTGREIDFLEQYTTLVQRHNLNLVLGLKVAVPDGPIDVDRMVEFCFESGILLVEGRVLRADWSASPCTSWEASAEEGNIACKGITYCSPHLQLGHVVMTDSKISSVTTALQYLFDERIA